MNKREKEAMEKGRHQIADPLGRKLDEIGTVTDQMKEDISSLREETISTMKELVIEEKDKNLGVDRITTLADLTEAHDITIALELLKKYCYEADILTDQNVVDFIRAVNDYAPIATVKGTKMGFEALTEADDKGPVSEVLLEMICICAAISGDGLNNNVLSDVSDYLTISGIEQRKIKEQVTENATLYNVEKLAEIMAGEKYANQTDKTLDNAASGVQKYELYPIVDALDAVKEAYDHENNKLVFEKAYHLNNPVDYIDSNCLASYQEDLSKHKITAKPYFSEKDGDIYKLLNEILRTDFRTDEFLNAICPDFNRYVNILHRQVTKDKSWFKEPSNRKYFGTELFGIDKIKRSYESGEAISDKGSSKGRNILREAAWVVVHNNMLARYMTEEKMLKMIPRTKNPERIRQWNSCIAEMYDIPQSVRDLYTIDENGDTKFAKHFENKEFKKDNMISEIDEMISGFSSEEDAKYSNGAYLTKEEMQPYVDSISGNFFSETNDPKILYKRAIYHYTGNDMPNNIQQMKDCLDKAAKAGLKEAEITLDRMSKVDVAGRDVVIRLTNQHMKKICKGNACYLKSECINDPNVQNVIKSMESNFHLTLWTFLGMKPKEWIAYGDDTSHGKGKRGIVFGSDEFYISGVNLVSYHYSQIEVSLTDDGLRIVTPHGAKETTIYKSFNSDLLKECLEEIKAAFDYSKCFVPLSPATYSNSRQLTEYANEDAIKDISSYDRILRIMGIDDSYSKEDYFFYLIEKKIVDKNFLLSDLESDYNHACM